MLTRSRQPDAKSSSATRTANAAPTAQPRMPNWDPYVKNVQFGVVAGPAGMEAGVPAARKYRTMSPSGSRMQISGTGTLGEALLPTCFAQQALGFESGRGSITL